LYLVVVTSRARRDLKKLDRPLKKKIILEAGNLAENPELGALLSAPYHTIRSYHFHFKGVEYRIAYHVENEKKEIIVHLVAPRENFYDKLRRALNL